MTTNNYELSELTVVARELSLYADNTYDLYKCLERMAGKYRDRRYTANQFDAAIRRYVGTVGTSYRKEFGLPALTNQDHKQLEFYFADAVRCWEF